MKKELVKYNINFLEHPLWFQDEKEAEQSPTGFLWQDNEGYLFKSRYNESLTRNYTANRPKPFYTVALH